MKRRHVRSHPAPLHGGPGRLLLLCAAALLIAGCGGRGCGAVIAEYYEASADDLRAPTRTHELRASKRRTEARPPKPPLPPPAPFDKVHPLVRARIAGLPPATKREFVVTFRDSIGPLVRSMAIGKQQLADTLKALRAPLYSALAADLDNDYDALRITDFWLIHAMVISMPVGEVDNLALRPDVIRIEPVLGGTPPQAEQVWGLCGSTDKGLEYARAHVGSDPYVEAGYGFGRVALFDTGVYTDHQLIKDGGRLVSVYECDQNECRGIEPMQQVDLWNTGHGTATAAILSGRSSSMPSDEGMTGATVESYNVYAPNATGSIEVNIPAAARAFETALLGEATLCVAEIAVEEGGPGALTEAAGAMFDYDVMVVVANGNDGNEVASPAGASRALGVGAYCAETNLYVREYVDGNTGDGRWKPDLTGPTSIYTAANGDPAAMGNYGGTSGATPFVAGAALLLHNRMETDVSVTSGNVYAALLLAADAEGAAQEEGAGRVRLPNDGAIYWGTLEVSQSEAWSLPIQIATAENAKIEALIWWPRSGATPYALPAATGFSDIDLTLYDPSGNEVAKSDGVGTVCERTAAEIPAGSSGKWWTAKIYGYSVPGDVTQTVYWAASVRNAE